MNKSHPTIYCYAPREQREEIIHNGTDVSKLMTKTTIEFTVDMDVWEIGNQHDLTQDFVPAHLLNLLSDRITESQIRTAFPNSKSDKFWIDPKGSVIYFDEPHHYDYLNNQAIYWGESFQKGWVRGFSENEQRVCVDFDKSKLSPRTIRGILKVISEYTPEIVVWEHTEFGAILSSETYKTVDFIKELRAIPQKITESAIPMQSPEGRPFTVWKNPTSDQLKNRGVTAVSDFRAIIANNDLYVWNAYQGTHTDIAKKLKVKPSHSLHIRDNQFDLWTDPSVLGNPNIEKAFPDARINTFESVEALVEAPISDISHVGDWDKNSSFRDPNDRKLLTSVKALTKIKSMWRYPEDEDFNIILVNNADANRWTEEGMVGKDRLPQMFPRSYQEIEPFIRDDQINIIYTNNKGSERVPMTGWIMAHRYGHALMVRSSSYYMGEALQTFHRYISEYLTEYGVRSNPDVYRFFGQNGPVTGLLRTICTFRAARENELRLPFEAFYDLFAQYIFRGKCVFNPLPREFKWGNQTYRYRGDDYEYWADSMDDLNYELTSMFDTAIRYSVGKVLVM